jgi:hypothetical protein
VLAACTSTVSPAAPTSSGSPVSGARSSGASVEPATLATRPAATLPPTTPTADITLPPTTTSTSMPDVDPTVLADITMTSVPPDVIVPTSDASLAEATNPINGRRSARRPAPEELDCAAGTAATCLAATLDALGFDVSSGPGDEQRRRMQRATAVVQLDAGLPVTGQPDDALRQYLDIAVTNGSAGPAHETRQIGTSAQGRPIMATRYGDGPRTVLVVGQTHGDEEGGLRVLLRARTLPVPGGITLWVVPTMNPDGLVLDTRFLANGADPNRRAPSQPEQRAVHDFALVTRPSLTVWYHQNYAWIGGSGASMAPAMQYQALTQLGTLKRSGDCAVGFMWCPIDTALGSSSILVELPDVLTPADVQIHALALLDVAAGGTP